MAERDPVLTLRELNRALLARQLLLKRAALAPEAAIERLAGLQAQWAPAPYVGLWSRLTRFAIADLERALAERRVVKATLMRGTLHLVSAADYPSLSVATTAVRPESWVPVYRRVVDDPERVHAATLRYAREPRTREELVAFLVTQGVRADLARPFLWWLIASRGWLVHAPPSGTWTHRRSGDLVAADRWLGRAKRPAVAPAVRHAVLRHLAAFGPATVEDVASWSAMRTPPIRDAIAGLGRGLREFRDERGRTLYDVARAPRPAGDTEAPVRFLPKWDSTLLAYAPPERVRILAEAHRRTVIGKNGDVAQTFLVDGMVAGTWELAAKRGAAVLTLRPFGRLTKADRLALEAEGVRLARFAMAEASAHHVVAA